MTQFENLPEVMAAPAPWLLKGSGYILAIRLPKAFLDQQSFLAGDLKASRRGPLAYVMFVDYQSSDVGPYHELLYIPGSLQFRRARHLTISRIYVSSWESVVNGQRNWGIPKDYCDFAVSYGKDDIDEVKLSLNGHVFAELKFRKKLFGLPFNGKLVPKKLRTLTQQFKGHEFTYIPEARGYIQPATLLEAHFDSEYFPDISQGKVVACVKVQDFQMIFPVSEITTI